jgi:hypothetical protein
MSGGPRKRCPRKFNAKRSIWPCIQNNTQSVVTDLALLTEIANLRGQCLSAVCENLPNGYKKFSHKRAMIGNHSIHDRPSMSDRLRSQVREGSSAVRRVCDVAGSEPKKIALWHERETAGKLNARPTIFRPYFECFTFSHFSIM